MRMTFALFITLICCAQASPEMNSLVGEPEMNAHLTRGFAQHITLLNQGEVEKAQKLASTMTDEDLAFYNEQFSDMRKSLVGGFFHTLDSRNRSLIFWSKFHERFSGVARAMGWVFVGSSAVLGLVGTFFNSCGATNWWSFSAVICNAVGLGGIFLASKSSSTSQNLDALMVATISKMQHFLTIVNSEIRKRMGDTEPLLESVVDQVNGEPLVSVQITGGANSPELNNSNGKEEANN